MQVMIIGATFMTNINQRFSNNQIKNGVIVLE